MVGLPRGVLRLMQSTNSDAAVDRRNLSLLAAAVALFAFVLFLSAIGNDFVSLDDRVYVLENPNLKLPFLSYVYWSLTNLYFNWHPVTWFSYGADFALWGLNPRGYHLTSVLLHAANAALVFLFAFQILSRCPGRGRRRAAASAAAVALLFSAHPIQVEAVAWTSARKDVLFAFFWLLAANSYLRRFGSSRPGAWYALSLAFFLLSASSKAMAVSFPAILLLIDAYPLRRLSNGSAALVRAAAEKVPFLVVAVLCSWVTVLAQKQANAIVGLDRIPLSMRLANASSALSFYLGKTFCPVSFVPFYPQPDEPVRLLGPAAAAFLIVSLAAVVSWRRWPWVACLWFAYVGLLLPTLGLVQVGGQSAADRYMYLPVLVPFLLVSEIVLSAVGWGERALPAWRAGCAAVVLLVVLGALSFQTNRQIAVWANPLSLWDHVIAENPDDARSLWARADLLVAAGRYAEAVADYDRLIAAESRRRFIQAPMAVYFASRANAHRLAGNMAAAKQDMDRVTREMGGGQGGHPVPFHPGAGTAAPR